MYVELVYMVRERLGAPVLAVDVIVVVCLRLHLGIGLEELFILQTKSPTQAQHLSSRKSLTLYANLPAKFDTPCRNT
jgi:hypothetical protein